MGEQIIAWERDRMDAFYRILTEEQRMVKVYCHCTSGGKTRVAAHKQEGHKVSSYTRYRAPGQGRCRRGCTLRAFGRKTGAQTAVHTELMDRVFDRLDKETPAKPNGYVGRKHDQRRKI